jgi:hypothetical protein
LSKGYATVIDLTPAERRATLSTRARLIFLSTTPLNFRRADERNQHGRDWER